MRCGVCLVPFHSYIPPWSSHCTSAEMIGHPTNCKSAVYVAIQYSIIDVCDDALIASFLFGTGHGQVQSHNPKSYLLQSGIYTTSRQSRQSSCQCHPCGSLCTVLLLPRGFHGARAKKKKRGGASFEFLSLTSILAGLGLAPGGKNRCKVDTDSECQLAERDCARVCSSIRCQVQTSTDWANANQTASPPMPPTLSVSLRTEAPEDPF